MCIIKRTVPTVTPVSYTHLDVYKRKVELKARFDEENNILWAKKLEEAGCHVIYGLAGLKTHCKILLVVRRDEDGIRRYLHMATRCV